MSNKPRRRHARGAGAPRISRAYDLIAHLPLTRENVGRENVYVCDECGGRITTIDRDPGVTPMFLACRATKGCKGPMVSSGYPEGPRPAHIAPPSWEWFRPTREQFARLSPEMKDHVLRGGLEFRQIVEVDA